MARAKRGGPSKKAGAAPKKARVEAEDMADVDEHWAQDAEDMADGDVGRMHFLSHAPLPDVASKGAQGRAKERLRDEKRRQRQALEVQPQDDASDVSTDMEGASESEDEMDDSLDSEAVDSEAFDSEAIDSEAVDSDEDPLEDAYLAKMQRREQRAEAERHALAQLPLPIRTERGVVEQDGHVPNRAVYAAASESEASEDETSEDEDTTPLDLAQRARSADARVVMRAIGEARERIAALASRITAEPEQSQGALRQLLALAQRRVPAPPDAPRKSVPMHAYIRQLAMLSLLAVFVDILPGYRIRALSETEERARVSQDVARRRDWEQSLVRLYREYLECCESDVRDPDSPLAPAARKCFCTLLVRAPHFNYRKNLLASVISILSRRAWTPASEQCYEALVQLLQQDRDGELALELVTLLYRMIRERKLAVHANVLDVLVHLRLRDELSRRVRRGPMGTRNEPLPPPPSASRRADPRDVRKGRAVHRSKKQVKRDREVRQIESEMREADATLDLAEREQRQSETLKLVFALYFRILKSEGVPVPLLASALGGMTHFAHHVSADFFRDVVQVLRTHVASALDAGDVRHALLCIVAAFELQAGQGGALELDLAAFYSALYDLMWPLALHTHMEEEGDGAGAAAAKLSMRAWSLTTLLFRALDLALVQAPRHTLHVSLDRTAAMLRRLLTAALHWPTTTTLRALQTAHAILARAASLDTRFEALVDNRDAIHDGTYDAHASQPESARVLASGQPCWELLLLSRTHANAQVRETASALLQWSP